MKKQIKTDVWTTHTWTREELIRVLSDAIGEEIHADARFYVEERTGSVYAGHTIITWHNPPQSTHKPQ